MHKKFPFHNKKHLSGFTLLEVMIALLVLSIGLLGIAALQANSLKVNHGAYQRSQAIFLAYDMMDRLRANRTAALAGQCDIAMGATLGGTDMCDVDVNDWQNNFVGALLPTGQGFIDCTTTANICVITVQWDEGRQAGSATTQFSITADL